MRQVGAALLFLLLALVGSAHAEVDVPPLKQRVTDLTGTLDAAQVQTLESKLAAFEQGKGSQLAILMLPSTQPETIEQYGIRVVDAWKLGRKGVDDGVLLLVAKDDHRVRIEVGYGLEGALNDATAKRIVSEVITPLFKRGDFFGGLDAGTNSIIKVIEGEPLPPPESQASQTSGDGEDGLGVLLGAGLVIFMIGNIILRQLLGRLPASTIVGGAIGLLAWIMLASLVAGAVVAIIAFALSLAFGVPRSSSFPSGWSSGSGGGWSSGGGSFGGSDWSGGGGSFGGGGASGDW